MKGLRRDSNGSSALETRIASVLGEMAPMLRIEHCRLEVAEFESRTGKLTIRVAGTCPDCLGSPAMFATAIEAHVKRRVPEVASVRLED